MSPPLPRGRRKGRPAGATSGTTEQRILEAALTLFAARGYDATGIRDIVATAGVTAPTLYHHCRTKRDLFARLLTVTCEQPLAAWEHVSPTETDWRDLLVRFAAESFTFARSDPRLSQLLFQSTFGPPLADVQDLLTDLAHRRFTIVRRLVEAGLCTKAIPPFAAAGGVDGLALAFCSLVDHHVNVLCREKATLARLTDDLALWLVGLCFGPPASPPA